MGRLINFVKRSHLRFCTLDYGTAVGNPNCGQRVADDNARVPKSICWFLGCIRSTLSEPKVLSNMQFTLVVFRCMAQGSLSSGVCWSKARLAWKARRLIVIDRSCVSSPACCLLTTPRVCAPAFPNGILHLWWVSAENTLIGTVSAVVDF